MADELQPHPQRARVLSELHARPFGLVATPKRVLHYAFMTDAGAAARAREDLAAFCAERGVRGPSAEDRHDRIELSDASLRWESHSEFTTYTWELDPGAETAPFQPPPDRLSGIMRALPQPGPLMVALDLHLLPEDGARQGPAALFGEGRTAAAEVADGAAVAATDFKADTHGFVRILVLDRALTPAGAGALLQRLLEVETYRTLALLGLQEAHGLAPVLRRIEIELPQILSRMQESEGAEENERLLASLTAMAAELEGGAAASLYRFGATRAYDELVRLRLQSLEERALPGLPTWSSFLSRRLNPAMRTCASAEERQANLSRKLTRAAQLLRTRVDVDLERQNSSLLHAMNERARTQLRLQQTVEGLSVAAITYYVAGLANLIFKGVHAAGVPLDPTIATAAFVPLALLGVAWTVRRIRRGHAAD
jgi:uncharacterized membrane-anchored protein